jgi:hypothetical protein
MLRRRGTESTVKTGRWVMPSEVTPFTTLAVLQRIESEGGLTADQRRELTDLMRRIERHYFSTGDRESAPDLTAELHRWIAVS